MKKKQKEEALRWLVQAEEEWKDAEELMKRERYYLALFLCQQSAEKALKGFIYLKVEEPVMSHSVAELLSLAMTLDAEFKTLKKAKRLDDYYIPTRYPNGLPGAIPAYYYDDPEEGQKALVLSEEIIKMARKKIEEKEKKEKSEQK